MRSDFWRKGQKSRRGGGEAYSRVLGTTSKTNLISAWWNAVDVERKVNVEIVDMCDYYTIKINNNKNVQ